MSLPSSPCRLRCLLLLALAPLPFAAVAAEEEDLFFGKLPVVGSVSRLQQPLSEAPGSITVIDQDLVRQSGARSLAELMRLVPGFFTTPNNQDSPRVTYHGLSNENYSPRVQVLIDGRSQYSPLFQSGVNWNLLPVALEDIERIEVMRGSNATAYGANAFMGVINVITKDPTLTRGWMVKVDHGAKSVRDTTMRWGGQVGTADVRFTYQQQGDDGLKAMYDGSIGWFDPHDSRHAKLLDLRATLPLSSRDELQFALSQASDVSQYGRPGSISDPFRDYSQSSTSFTLGWRRSFAADNELRVRFSHVEDWGSDRYISVSGGKNYPISNGGTASSTELELQHILPLATSLRAVWGGGVRSERVRSVQQFFTNDDLSRVSSRVFGNLEWRPERDWLLNLGANLEHASVGGTVLDPRASVSYHITPDQTLRLVASRAHRIPSLFELRGDTRKIAEGTTTPVDRTYVATLGIQPERVDTLEIGYLWELKPLRASLDLRAFHEHLPNRLQWAPVALTAATQDSFPNLPKYPYGTADSYINAEDTRVHGIEYQFKWQPFTTTRLIYNHSYIRIDANIDDPSAIADSAPNVDKIYLHTRYSAPRHAGMVMWMQQLPYGFESSVSYYKTSYMRWTRNSYIDPIERVDWRLARPFKWGANRGEIAYVGQAANRTNAEFRNTRLVGERHWISLRLDF